MPQIYCTYYDCENYEDGLCQATAIRLDPLEGCLVYTPFDRSSSKKDRKEQGDALIWDEEYFEYEFLDDEGILF